MMTTHAEHRRLARHRAQDAARTRVQTSVIICVYTQERWDDMTRTISSALAQPEAGEVIVVVDHEDALLKRMRARWPGLAVIPNTFPRGLSGARNTGIEAASGEIVAFLDDDATAGQGWLRELLTALREPGAVAVGGRAQPVWPAGRPARTLPPELLWVVGCTYRGQPAERAEVRNVMGCSMVFRRDALVAVGGFHSDTGRLGAIPLGGEETDVCIRIKQAYPHARILFEPRSVVAHRVTAERTTWRYLRRRSFYEGVSKAVLSRRVGSAAALQSETAYTARVLPAGVCREVAHGRLAGAAAILFCLAATGTGYLRGRWSAKPAQAGAEPAAEGTAQPDTGTLAAEAAGGEARASGGGPGPGLALPRTGRPERARRSAPPERAAHAGRPDGDRVPTATR